MSFKKIVGLTGLLGALALIIYIVATIGLNYSSQSDEELSSLWRQDINNLAAANYLPVHWTEIRAVEKIYGPNDKTAKKWAKHVAAPIAINPNGDYKLEILFISDNDDGHHLAIIRHHLIHVPSGNSVFELSRTYDLN